MQHILVISDEPALAETLASELPDLTVTGVREKDAKNFIHDGKFCLIVTDNDVDLIDSNTHAVVKLSRPIRLSEALYTIAQQLKSKTASSRKELMLGSGCVFLADEKVIHPAKSSAPVILTEKETKLLQKLMENKATALSREALLKNIWGYGEAINTHTLETHIYRLRTKLKQANEGFDIVFSEEGGYRFENIHSEEKNE